ncbi:MAG: hypothetical protein LBV61_08570, partial [Burkholderiaceae bacterium]|nr:hypothetical protein [Burkholderiaceae bacterium]
MTPVEAYDHLRRLSQTKRLLRLTFPYDDAPQIAQHSQLVINRLEAQEGLGLAFQYTLELLSAHQFNAQHLAHEVLEGEMGVVAEQFEGVLKVQAETFLGLQAVDDEFGVLGGLRGVVVG